ncbi:TonB-dependent receptor plug domain-containing protein [Catenovulum sediminis]|uniref:TonB-dependent receptor plug domain-containing protein n=1 Tax=Catenovulum sediminis TaxID=1740262 RepID=A0ABV1REH3_9ALTE
MYLQKKNKDGFKLKPVYCALAALMTIPYMPTSAAQENTQIENEAEVIKVTGVRTSLAAATANKRFSAQVVDSIVADDIGKLPDNTIAESLGRVAGVQVDQGIGEGSSISIRGLRDNVTLYNGRTIIDVNGRGGTGMDTLNTSTYSIMAMIPSALSKQLNVTKLASADMIDGGMGGVVNIESRKPLDVSGEQIAASYAANYNDQNKDLGHQLFGLYSNTFDNDKFGILLSANYDKREVSQDGFATYNGWTEIEESISVFDANGQQLDIDSQGNPVQIIGNMNPRFQQLVDDRDRLSSSLIAQWRPIENLTLTSDLLYSKFDSIRDRYWLSTNFTSDLYDAELDENNFLVAANTEMFLENNSEYVDLTTDLFSGAVNADWDLTDNVNVFAEVSYSDSKSERAQIYNRLRTLSSYDTRFDVREGEFGGIIALMPIR